MESYLKSNVYSSLSSFQKEPPSNFKVFAQLHGNNGLKLEPSSCALIRDLGKSDVGIDTSLSRDKPGMDVPLYHCPGTKTFSCSGVPGQNEFLFAKLH